MGVADESHGQLFARIKATDDRVQLLVVDPATEQHYQRRQVTVDSNMRQVLVVTCPDVRPPPPAVALAAPAYSGITFSI